MAQKLVAVAAAAIASTTIATAAHADEPRGVDWTKVLTELDRVARSGTERPAPITPLRQQGRPAPIDDPSPQNMGNAWFGVAPRVTLVARDWASSTRLAGDRLSLVEQMRLSASTRMVVGRVRLSGARFTPFLQVGLGQWRVDRNYLPLTPNTIEVASQLGTGFELRLTRRWQLATETTLTSLIREGQNNSLPQTMLWSAFVASRVEF
jgi:hypothetical protein